jgi:hypothetical protein
MKDYGGYDSGKYIRYGYQLSFPTLPNQYQLCPPPKAYPVLYRENALVDHMFKTIEEKTLNKNLSDGIESLFNDRLDLIRSKIEFLLLQLGQRKMIKDDILCQIEDDSCKAQNLIFEMGIRAYHVDRDRLNLEKVKLDLEKQKRMELANYFRDTGMINKDLKDALIQYLSETQKSSIMNTEERI